MKSFEKCCLSSAMHGTIDDMLWNGSEENGNVRSECEKYASSEYEDGDSGADW